MEHNNLRKKIDASNFEEIPKMNNNKLEAARIAISHNSERKVDTHLVSFDELKGYNNIFVLKIPDNIKQMDAI